MSRPEDQVPHPGSKRENKFHNALKGRLQRSSSKWGGGGFAISDDPGREGGGGVVLKFRTSKKLKFQMFSELISYVISIYFYYKINYFYCEKPLRLNMLLFKHPQVQITTRGQLSRDKK